jgi:hypothetical protein
MQAKLSEPRKSRVKRQGAVCTEKPAGKAGEAKTGLWLGKPEKSWDLKLCFLQRCGIKLKVFGWKKDAEKGEKEGEKEKRMNEGK